MEEQNATPEVKTKPAMAPDEIYRRNLVKMPDRVLRSHLRKKNRQSGSLMDGAWATVLSTIFESKAAPYLR